MNFELSKTLEYTELTLESETRTLYVTADAEGLELLAKDRVEDETAEVTLDWKDATALILNLLAIWERWVPDHYREPKPWQILDPDF